MINTLFYGIGFLIYAYYTMLTLDIYSKKEEETNVFVLFIIFLFYSILIGYVINFLDNNEKFYVKIVEIGIYVIVNGIITAIHVFNYILPKDKEYGFIKEDNKI
jgi:uncharacterized membrane protein YczE